MIFPRDDPEQGNLLTRWPTARRTLRRLPVVADEPVSERAILDLTIDRSTTGAPGPRPLFHTTDRTEAHRRPADDRDPTRRRAWTFAAAAGLVIATAAAWIWWPAGADTRLTETELTRLETDVELALVRLGRVLHETERIAMNDVLGAGLHATATD